MRPIRDLVMSDVLVKHERHVSQAITRAEVRGILKFCQSVRHRITYVCLAKALGMFSGGKELAKILGEIMLEDKEADDGVLSSLVVKASTGMPGHGYFEYARQLYDFSIPDVKVANAIFWRNQMGKLGWGFAGQNNIVIGSVPYDAHVLSTMDEDVVAASGVFTTSGPVNEEDLESDEDK
jgi:hypothetical protein